MDKISSHAVCPTVRGVEEVVVGSLCRLEVVGTGAGAVGNPRDGEVYLGSIVAVGRAGGRPATGSLKGQEWWLPIKAGVKLPSFTCEHVLTRQCSIWSTGCSGFEWEEEQAPGCLFRTVQFFLQQPQKQSPGHQTAHSAQTHQQSLASPLLKKVSGNPDRQLLIFSNLFYPPTPSVKLHKPYCQLNRPCWNKYHFNL